MSGGDAYDADFIDENCDGSDGVASACVYVSPSLGDDEGGMGFREAPLKSSSAAIAYASANGLDSVCLSGEIFHDSVYLRSGISLYGSFDQNDPDFKFRRKAEVTTTLYAVGAAITAEVLTVDTRVQGLSINAFAPPTPGASAYGILSSTSTGTLIVRDNLISSGPGSVGDDGPGVHAHLSAQANTGEGGVNGCQNQSCGTGGVQGSCAEDAGNGGDGGYNNQDGQVGSAGSGNAAVGTAGISTKACLFPSGNGGPGGPRADGVQGTPGEGGQPGTLNMSFVPGVGSDGKVGINGKGRSGGGGGGSCMTGGLCTCTSDKGGGGGAGGCGGLGGKQGRGGGSFGVVVLSGDAVVSGNTIAS